MKIDSYSCDSCRTMKGQHNFWFHVVDTESLPDPRTGQVFRDVRVLPWQTPIPPTSLTSLDACGETCAMKMVSAKLAEWKQQADAEVKAMLVPAHVPTQEFV